MTAVEQHPERLRWQCRRGLLELDYLLETYLDHAYSALSKEDKALFEDILKNHDPDLQSWLLSGEDAPLQYRVMLRHILEISRLVNSQ
jgi:antitoxin CptB